MDKGDPEQFWSQKQEQTYGGGVAEEWDILAKSPAFPVHIKCYYQVG